ncbi:hypothetical protein T01_10758 [Trichinella spiralis]|uniref:Uncharacterized protein n=1 Tax=Trichinella spiralis TaxID=6334 RepID=A0A0V1BL70_TRISP|nr:hypothetical protein T01_10758 [Trichinella spiralis]
MKKSLNLYAAVKCPFDKSFDVEQMTRTFSNYHHISGVGRFVESEQIIEGFFFRLIKFGEVLTVDSFFARETMKTDNASVSSLHFVQLLLKQPGTNEAMTDSTVPIGEEAFVALDW